MSKSAKENKTTAEWMRPPRKLSETERQELRDAIRGYVSRRKAEGAAQ